MNNKEAIVLFTRAPEKGKGKSRLKNFLSEEMRYNLQKKLIDDSIKKVKETKKEFLIYYIGKKECIDYLDGLKVEQRGNDLGQKMYNAFEDTFKNYERVVLFGSDVYDIDKSIIEDAFYKLDEMDIVIAPAEDGGFGVIGMKKAQDIFSNIVYSREDVFENILNNINQKGLSYHVLRAVHDIDDREDLIKAEIGTHYIECIGSGEYNINYRFNYDYVFRINMASQMNLGEKQIEYEYKALKELEETEVVPKVYKYETKGKYIPYGYLIMDYLEGRPLNYSKDLKIAAKLLSKIHNKKVISTDIIKAEYPFKSMYEECKAMFSYYKNWSKKEERVESLIQKMLSIAYQLDLNRKIDNPCIINTELNSGNFIIGEKSFVIDWEKPILGECEQDIAHFLVPTTTNWKTDTILTEEEIEEFLNEYEKYRDINMDKLKTYFVFNCLRGVTWCSMAKVEYESENRKLNNKDTFEKINLFLSEKYLNFLFEKFFKECEISEKKQ